MSHRAAPTEASSSSIPSTIALVRGLWLLGAASLLAGLAASFGSLYRLRRFSRPWKVGEATVSIIATQAGVHRPISVMLNERTTVPATYGILRPTIILPPDAPQWPDADLWRVLIHEIEHVRRGDWAVQLAARAVCSLYWCHPLVWVVWRQLRVEAERSCDDAVVERADRTDYAEQLVTLATRMMSPSHSLMLSMAQRGDLSTRVGAILNVNQQRGRAGMLAAAGIIGVVALLIATVASLQAVSRPQSVPVAKPVSEPRPVDRVAFVEEPTRDSAPDAQPQAASAQNSSRGPEFAVASIKPLEPGAPIFVGITVYPGGRLLIRATTLKSLISTAFGMPLAQISGGEPWTQSQMFSLEATPPEELQSQITNRASTWTSIADETLKTMLRALLIDRFHLELRRETKTATVYVLKQSGQPLRLQPVASTGAGALDGMASTGYAGGQWVIGNMSMRQFAEFASNYYLKAPVLDQTGLEGRFFYRQAQPDIDPKYGDANESALSFLRMVKDVGLQLEKTEGPVETLVIESAEKPSPN